MSWAIARKAVSSTVMRQINLTSTRAVSTADVVGDKSRYVFSREEPEYKLGKHRSNALELVEKQAIIEVDGPVAVCDGGGGALGHPVEYIKLGKRADYGPGMKEEDGYPCIYCGLRYRQKSGSGH
mmetsp:Transcript_139/g.185  ORF Transcript_139/g.185 Transcript_139/m.185 type:complete len:125 (-) Transcript_139:312-686(-)|eukprot:CAMPEP_0197246538 /NCGR_PEP_ID=MMETSP1429-20130617/15573_1 /TAXON_ID=49237 /ORGANISM="Chaetoceros  sp., Strain UNC1202" /LENGTH=124 /DNA_ID=CAMNT_0042707215 /DNA_START=11 /DNA_END=385 /DNA_ORIENTATION=-